MFCVNCGKELKDTARFCPFCGNKIDTAEKNAEPVQKPVVKEEPKAAPVQKPVVKEEPKAEPVQKPVVKEEPKAEPVQIPVIKEEPKAKPVEMPSINTTPVQKPVIKEEPKAAPVQEKPVIKEELKAAPVQEKPVIKEEPKVAPVQENSVIKETPKPVMAEKQEAVKPAKKNGKAAAIAAAAVAVAGVALAVPFYVMPSMEYAKADKAITEGRYAEAYEIFNGLDFKDSKVRANEASYGLAVEKMNSGNYAEAYADFNLIPDYSDSAALAKQCEFGMAQQLLDAGDFKAAAAAFKAMGDYSGAKEKYSEALFAHGDSLAEAGEYLKAIEITAEAENAGYEDKMIMYRIGAAETYFGNGDYAEAIEILEPYADMELDGAPVSEFMNKYLYYRIVEKMDKGMADADDARLLIENPYMDSQLKVMQLYSDLGAKAVRNKNYYQAALMYRNAGNYNNASQLLNDAMYQLAGAYIKDSAYDNARNIYAVLGGYKDCAKLRNDAAAQGSGTHNGWNADACTYLGTYAFSEFRVGDKITVKGVAGNDANTAETVTYLVKITSGGASSAPVVCPDLSKGSSFEAVIDAAEAMKGDCTVEIILANTGHVLNKFTFTVK